jgi:hypothetical protein
MAVLVLKQCHELRPDDPLVLLHAAKLCLNNLHQVFDFIVLLNGRWLRMVVEDGG